MAWSHEGSRHRTSTATHKANRKRIFKRDNHTCQVRGPRCNGQAQHLDHKDNTLTGAAYDADTNLQAACAPCNQWKAAHEGNAARAAKRARLRLPEDPHPGTVRPRQIDSNRQ